MNTSDIIQIMDHFSKSGLAEMKLKQEQFSLLLKKESNHPEAAAFAAQTGLQAGTGLNNESGTGSAASANAGQNTLASGQADAQNADLANRNLQTSSTGQADAQVDNAAPTSDVLVKAPLAGVFYRAAGPEEEPFVTVGQQIKKGDTVGLIEAMKMINEIPAPCDGTVTEILMDNEAFAEFDAALIGITKA